MGSPRRTGAWEALGGVAVEAARPLFLSPGKTHPPHLGQHHEGPLVGRYPPRVPRRAAAALGGHGCCLWQDPLLL